MWHRPSVISMSNPEIFGLELLACCRSGRGKKRNAEGTSKAAGSAKANKHDPKCEVKDAPEDDPTDDPTPASQDKPKRKYVKSGKFVGKFGSYQKQKEAKTGQAEQPSSTRKKQNAGRAMQLCKALQLTLLPVSACCAACLCRCCCKMRLFSAHVCLSHDRWLEAESSPCLAAAQGCLVYTHHNRCAACLCRWYRQV